ncbi:MAG: hypothetical protein CMM24_07260 [Rhodospirillaceae bacterium]|nr:hypothetical protein [Rhodospirillaceae bacterium]
MFFRGGVFLKLIPIGIYILFGAYSHATDKNLDFNTSLKKLDEAVKAIGNKTGTGTTLFYDPIKDIAGSVDGAFYNQKDKNWAKAALTIYDFYRGLGGEALQKTIYFKRKDGSFLITISGQNNVWHASADKALTFFLFNLLDQSDVLSGHHLSGVSRTPNEHLDPIKVQLTKLIQSAKIPPTLNAGKVLELLLPKSEIAIGGNGLNVREYKTTTDGISAKVLASSDAKPGLNSVFGFSSKTKFRPSSVAVVNVIANGEEGSSQKHKMKRGTEEVTLLSRGQEKHYKINNAEEKRFKFSLTSSSTVRLKSRGPTDVVGAIFTKKGKIILSDDDSGRNYNFAIHQKLPPGDYILSVRHCCFGEGPFSLTFDQDPANKTRPSN